MKVFEVTLTTHAQVLMEAKDAAEARECARCRWGRAIHECGSYEIDVTETAVSREDPRVLVA